MRNLSGRLLDPTVEGCAVDWPYSDSAHIDRAFDVEFVNGDEDRPIGHGSLALLKNKIWRGRRGVGIRNPQPLTGRAVMRIGAHCRYGYVAAGVLAIVAASAQRLVAQGGEKANRSVELTPTVSTGILERAEPLITFSPISLSPGAHPGLQLMQSSAMSMLDPDHFTWAALDRGWRAVFTRQD